MKNYYSALIIDIKKSKKYELQVRNELQEYLTKCIRLLNTMYQSTLSCEVTFSAGDELQGLFESPSAAVLYWRLLEFMVYPVEIRAGIGIGEWNVRIEGGLSTEQDGPAYHNARAAIDEVYKKQLQKVRINSKSEKDLFANFLLNNSMGYKSQQNYIQNILQLAAEIMYPFQEESSCIEMNGYAYQLLALKEGFKVRERTFNRSAGRLFENSKDKKLCVHGIIPVTGDIQEAEEAVARKGLSVSIAEATGKSRQNINTVMKRGNVLLIRSMDYMALQYIRKKYGGRYDS